MRAFEHGVAMWGVECPEPPSRVAGVTMAGFRVRELEALRIVPHPAVTLLLDLGAGSPVLDCVTGQQRGAWSPDPGWGPRARSGRGE